MTFAKLFETPHGQVLAMIQPNSDGDAPEIRFFAKPEGFDVCSMAFGYPSTDCGWDMAEEGFAKVDMEMATKAYAQIRKVTCDD